MGDPFRTDLRALHDRARPRRAGDEPDFHRRRVFDEAPRLDDKAPMGYGGGGGPVRRHERHAGGGADLLAEKADAGGLVLVLLACAPAAGDVLPAALRGGRGVPHPVQRIQRRGAFRAGGYRAAGLFHCAVFPRPLGAVQRAADSGGRLRQLRQSGGAPLHAAEHDRPDHAHPAGKRQGIRRADERPDDDRKRQGERLRRRSVLEMVGLCRKSPCRQSGNAALVHEGASPADAPCGTFGGAGDDRRRLFHHGGPDDRRRLYGGEQPDCQVPGADAEATHVKRYDPHDGNADAAPRRRAPLSYRQPELSRRDAAVCLHGRKTVRPD